MEEYDAEGNLRVKGRDLKRVLHRMASLYRESHETARNESLISGAESNNDNGY